MKLDENQNVFKGLGRFTYLKRIDYKTGSLGELQKLKVSKKKLAGMLAEADDAFMQVLKDQSGKKLSIGMTLYAQDKLNDALMVLSEVTHDEKQSEDAI